MRNRPKKRMISTHTLWSLISKFMWYQWEIVLCSSHNDCDTAGITGNMYSRVIVYCIHVFFICCISKIKRGTAEIYHYWNGCVGIYCLQLPTDNAPYLSIYTYIVCGLGSGSLDIHQGWNTADHSSKFIYLKLYLHAGLTGHFQLRLCCQSDVSII